MKTERVRVTKPHRLWWAAVLSMVCLATSPVVVQDAAGANVSEGSPRTLQRVVGTQKAAEQRHSGHDAGDFYLTPTGRRHLFRLSGSMAIRLKPPPRKEEGISSLTGPNGPLEGYTVDVELANDVFVLKASRSERQRQRLEPGRLNEAITNARRHPDLRTANPIFFDPETGLARMATEEMLLRLKPETDPQAYFGEAWTQAKRVAGTRDQFILTVPLATAEELLAEANRRAGDPRVVWAEPNFISQVIKQAGDPLVIQQWSLNNQARNGGSAHADVNAPGAWTNSTGSPGIVIAVLDDGVQLDHPDLKRNIFSNPGEALNGLDDDGNGYVDDVHGWDFYGNDNDPGPAFSSDAHGTAAAGIAAAGNVNGTGLAGVAYGCKIMPVKVIAGNNWVSDSVLAEALYYAAGRTRDGLGVWRGADVISISLSFPRSSAVDDALLWASANGRGGKGCAIFAAAGDDASRWKPTRVRLPVGAVQGPGTYRFGLEYSKDVSSSDGEDLVKIDNVALLSGDGSAQSDSPLGPNGRQDFEGVFPPAGWQFATSLGVAFWNATTNQALAGTGGSISARSAALSQNQWTELRTPLLTLTGAEILSFSCYVSSEQDYDGLKIWVYDADDNYLTVFEGPMGAPFISGNPAVPNAIHYPASHPQVIAVGASTDSDLRSDYSQSGPGLEFLAPSSGGWNDIITTDRTGPDGYADGDYVPDFGGTSASCPLAAGIGALVLSVNPSLTASEVRNYLRNSCDKIGGVVYDGNGWNSSYGFGRLNAQRAVDDARKTAPVNLSLSFASSPATVNSGSQLTYVLIVSNQGPATALGVLLTNVLPDSVRFVSSSLAPSFTPASSTRVFALGALSSGGFATVSIVAATVGTGTITNSAYVTSASMETDPANDRAEAITDIAPFFVEITSPANNATLLAPTNITISASATDLEGAITNVEFFAGTTKVGQATHPPYTVTWLNPPHGDYTLTVRVTDNHGKKKQSPAVAVSLAPGLTVSDSTVLEGNAGAANVLFAIRLSAPSTRTITVNYSTADGVALAGRDYVPTNGTVVFPPGTVVQNVPVAIKGNTLSESNKTFGLNLSHPVNSAIAHGHGMGTIVDNDAAPALFINDVTVREGDAGTTNANFMVRLSAVSGKTVTVNYSTANGSATGNLDFVPTAGRLSFPPGVTNQTLAIAVIGDTLSENTETFLVNLSSPVNATIADSQGIGTILDNDPNPALAISDANVTEGNLGTTNAVFAVGLSAPSGKTITVTYSTASGTAIAGRDFVPVAGTLTFPAGTTNQVIRVGVIGDTLSESNETFWVNLTNAVNATITDGHGLGTILDNDPLPSLSVSDGAVLEPNVGTANALFTVRLSVPSGRPISVGYATADGTALAGKDYLRTNGTVLFPPGSTFQTFLVAVIGDTLSESNETFLVNLSNPVNAVIADGQGVGTILDTDPAPYLYINDVTVTEGDVGTTNAIFTVRLSTPSGKLVKVNYSTANSTALVNLDFLPASGTLTFPPGVTNQTLSVAVLGDTLHESTEKFLVNLSSPINAVIADGQGVGTILDDDFKITAARIVGTNVLVSFPTLAARACRVEFADQLPGSSAVWSAVLGASNLAGTGKTLTVTNFGGAAHSNRFYRVRMLP